MARGKDISPDALAKLDAKRLAELLAEACQNDPPLRRKIEILLASKQGGEELGTPRPGKQIGEPLKGNEPLYSAAFSPDGERIAFGSKN